MIKFFWNFLKRKWFFILPLVIVLIVVLACNTVKVYTTNKQDVNTIPSVSELQHFTYYGTYSVPVENE